MIKINLLAEGRKASATRKSSAGGSFLERDDIALWMLLLLLLVPLLIAGAFWWKFDRDLQAKQAEVAAAREEVQRLQKVLEEVAEFEAKKAELEHKIEVINNLKANQRGPVRVMDAISASLPELLWLDRMTLGPSQITLAGRAFNFNAVANFIDNLDQVPEFQEPNLRDSSQRDGVFSFVIAFNYTYRPQETSEDEEGETGEESSAAAGQQASLSTGR